VASYSFNAGTGTTAADASGNGNSGTIQGATWTTQGKYGAALVFNGSSSRITVNESNSLDLTNGMTLEAWVYPTATPTNWSTVVMKEQSGELVYVLYAGSPANRPNTYIYTTGEQGFAGPSALPLNTWSHLATTYDGATLRLYVNATQVASAAISGNIIASTGVLRIGGNGVWGEYFRGRIDEVRVYKRALGQTEIQTDMNTPLTP
jgi:Concanavalin A-like lectin/glucanases superfamily